MIEKPIDSQGHLIEALKPAIYLDSSVVIDYWLTDGAEVEPPPEIQRALKSPPLDVIRNLLKTDSRFSVMVEMRRTLAVAEEGPALVTSPLALLELIEWQAETGFKNLAADATGVKTIQRKGKKEIGQLLAEILEQRANAVEAGQLQPGDGTSGIEWIFVDTTINPSYVQSHGLRHVNVVDVTNFALTEGDVWGFASVLSYCQMGVADILHLLAAHHLGCESFASFDSDFLRNKKDIEQGLGIHLISTPDELLAAIKKSDSS